MHQRAKGPIEAAGQGPAQMYSFTKTKLLSSVKTSLFNDFIKLAILLV
jgi:hypothetical protein